MATGLLPAAVAPAVVPSARVPQMAGKSSVRVCLPMRTLLLQTVYTHIKSNDICMLVCMFELGFKVGSAPLMEPQAAFYIYKLAMGFLSQQVDPATLVYFSEPTKRPLGQDLVYFSGPSYTSVL